MFRWLPTSYTAEIRWPLSQRVFPLVCVMLAGCTKDPRNEPLCGVNLHTDDAMCENGQVEAGELCLKESGTIPRSKYMYAHNNLSLADFNGDGHIDLRVGADIYAGHGDGTFAETYVRPSGSTGLAGSPGTLDCAEGDFDGDGITDLLFATSRVSWSNPAAALVFWRGNKSLDPSTTDVFWGLDGLYPVRVAAGDFTGDGLDDIAVAVQIEDILLCDVRIFLRAADSFVLTPEVLRGASNGLDCLKLGARDLDGDGHVDLDTSAVDFLSATGLLYLGDGTGHFTPLSIASGPRIANAAFGHDLDCDGVLDAVNPKGVWRGLGDVQYEVVNPEVGAGAALHALREMNGDAEPDLLMAGPSGLEIRFGDADFTFSEPLVLLANSTLEEIELADLNEDGRLDIAALTDNGVTLVLTHL